MNASFYLNYSSMVVSPVWGLGFVINDDSYLHNFKLKVTKGYMIRGLYVRNSNHQGEHLTGDWHKNSVKDFFNFQTMYWDDARKILYINYPAVKPYSGNTERTALGYGVLEINDSKFITDSSNTPDNKQNMPVDVTASAKKSSMSLKDFYDKYKLIIIAIAIMIVLFIMYKMYSSHE